MASGESKITCFTAAELDVLFGVIHMAYESMYDRQQGDIRKCLYDISNTDPGDKVDEYNKVTNDAARMRRMRAAMNKIPCSRTFDRRFTVDLLRSQFILDDLLESLCNAIPLHPEQRDEDYVKEVEKPYYGS